MQEYEGVDTYAILVMPRTSVIRMLRKDGEVTILGSESPPNQDAVSSG